MTSLAYKRAYAQLGDERVQVVNFNAEVEAALARQAAGHRRDRQMKSALELWDGFFATRVDENWSQFPGYMKRYRRPRREVFFCTIPQILLNLEPANTFNPAEVWEEELAKNSEENRQQVAAVDNKKAKIRADIAAKSTAKRLELEVTRIRNSRNNLLSIIRKTKIHEARAILLVQILKQAYDGRNTDKRLLYETLWAVEALGPLPRINAPKPADKKSLLVKESGLIYDNFSDVEKLLRKARDVMDKEPDMIKLQLNDMSDSLPPLTKFTFGFKLDTWQRRVLTWIDAGKSVVICAPTSSGKTVLSSYVAIIFKSHSAGTNEDGEDGGVVRRRRDEDGDGPKRQLIVTGTDENEEEDLAEDDEDEDDDLADDDEGDAMKDADDGWDDPFISGLDDNQQKDIGELSNKDLNETSSMKHNSESGDIVDPIEHLLSNDRKKRLEFNARKRELDAAGREEPKQNVLFVVPKEPLVWQVAAYFTKLLREEGDQDTKVAIVTDQITYYPPNKFDVMPQIVVGTPLALETALTKPRGLVGKFEIKQRAQGDLLPGGFDRFDWVIYDEVHALNGEEGAALQRLIRSMSCKFLALSATVGNAEELRGWMERVKGDHMRGVEVINVDDHSNNEEELGLADIQKKFSAMATATATEIRVQKTSTGETVNFYDFTIDKNTVRDLKQRICEVWPDAIDKNAAQMPHTRYPLQLLFGDIDLAEDTATLNHYIRETTEHPITIQWRSVVHLLSHQGRFINLQRYMWDDSETISKRKLKTISPLLAVDSVESLQRGILDKSSLSFTSRDSFRLWEEIERTYPLPDDMVNVKDNAATASQFTVNELDDSGIIRHMNPYIFFGANERITLQRTKDYEDILKAGLKLLATQFPLETRELLNRFSMKDPSKELDLCELVLDLKDKDMLPCLPFHLNTFEAIRLFQQLLAGIEWRQKTAHPTYYTDLKRIAQERKDEVDRQIQATGGNDRVLEEQIRFGEISADQPSEIDELAPHPNFVLSKGIPLTQQELDALVDEMENYDGFEQRDKSAMKAAKGKNLTILNHALIRGLRRGIGLFIDEVSFPSYRRAVQRLASQGKLGVVISDNSLAFGVNMPFRTCVFCGSMFGELDELMAQQMSGRAGRRGLDTQGNLVYAGTTVSHIRRLMIGTVCRITGSDYNPRYEGMILQSVLSPRHVGWSRSAVLGGRTLLEHVKLSRAEITSEDIPSQYTMDISRQAMTDLGLILESRHPRTGELHFVPNYQNQCTYSSLAIVWQLRDQPHESATIGLLFPDLMETFNEMVKSFAFHEKKMREDLTEQLVLKFFSVFFLLIGRTHYEGGEELKLASTASDDKGTNRGPMRMSDLPYFHLPAHREMVTEWEERFRVAQIENIPERWSNLRDPVPPGSDLDGTLFQCVLDRSLVHDLNDEMKQRIKARLWRAGNVLKFFKNCSWPEENYNRVAFFIFRTAFKKLKYLNSELIRGRIDFPDVSAAERESRTDATDTRRLAALKPQLAGLWSDNDDTDVDSANAPAWHSCVERAAERNSEGGDNLLRSINAFTSLRQCDLPLLKFMSLLSSAAKTNSTSSLFGKQSVMSMANQAHAIATCSYSVFGQKTDGSSVSLRTMGVLIWLCTVYCPQLLLNKFPIYLGLLVDSDEDDEDEEETGGERKKSEQERRVVTDEHVRMFHSCALSYEQILPHIPSSHKAICENGVIFEDAASNPVTEDALQKLRTSCDELIEYLDQEPDEEEDEEDEES